MSETTQQPENTAPEQPGKQETQAQPNFEQVYREGYRNAFDLVDKNVFELTKIEKQPYEKTNDYQRRAFEEFFKAQQPAQQPKEEPQQDNLLQKQLEASQARIKEIEGLLGAKEKEFSNYLTRMQVEASIPTANIQAPPHFTDQQKQAFKERTKQMLVNDILSRPHEIKDGQIIFKDGEGLPLVNGKTTKPLSVGDILDKDFGFYFAQPKAIETKETVSINDQGKQLIIENEPKSEQDIVKILSANGLTQTDKEFLPSYLKLKEKYGL